MLSNRIKKGESYKNLRSIYHRSKNLLKRNIYSVFGYRKYDKFVIVASARTGSNLLVSYLNSHPGIETGAEIFGLLKGRSCNEVWNDFYSYKSRKVKLAGFKIFYPHPLDSDDHSVWDIIEKDKDIKIIHLVRENKLKTFVSGAIARKTNQWTRKSDQRIPLEEKRIEIDTEALIDKLRKVENYENDARKRFKDHQFKEISYEMLVADKRKIMSEIFDFLNMSEMEIDTSHKKQNTEGLHELIINYDAVIETLSKTEFKYLTE